MNENRERRKRAQKYHLENSLIAAEKEYRYLINNNPQDCDIANLGLYLGSREGYQNQYNYTRRGCKGGEEQLKYI